MGKLHDSREITTARLRSKTDYNLILYVVSEKLRQFCLERRRSGQAPAWEPPTLLLSKAVASLSGRQRPVCSLFCLVPTFLSSS